MTTLDTVVLDASISTGSGVSADIKTTISYPKGYGLFTATVMESLPDYAEHIAHVLYSRDDASTIEGAEAATSAADAERDSVALTVAVTTEDGVEIPMTVEFEYPVGYGLLILAILSNIGGADSRNNVLRGLINSGDESVVAAAMKL